MFLVNGGDFFATKFLADADHGKVNEVHIMVGEFGGKLRHALPIVLIQMRHNHQTQLHELSHFVRVFQIPRSLREATLDRDPWAKWRGCLP